jgi:dihydroorotate dehydrogenase (fumarate)
MADLSTEYCGLELSNPFLVAASPLTADLASAKQLQSAGAAGIILPSLFEEAVNDNASALTAYINKIQDYKSALNVPVIASLNGVSEGGWLDHAATLEQAGCDAIELNVYYIAADAKESSDQIERRYIDLVYKLRAHISIPLSIKITHQFSSVAHLVKRLEETGVDGVVLFNRFYLPDIDIDTMTVSPTLQLSTSQECLLRIRWVAILREQIKLSLGVTGGIHTVDDVLKALLAGADAIQLCSVLFQQGIEALTQLNEQLNSWVETSEYESVNAFKGKMSAGKVSDPSSYERSNYRQVLASNR